MHLNPKVREIAREHLSGHPDLYLVEPLDYAPFANLMARCHLVLTDSGGIQEEAPALGKPVLVLRTETERPEAVEAGTVLMAGVEEERIYTLGHRLLTDGAAYAAMASAVNPYGDGRAAERIARLIGGDL
jgi:UDP-N-acetylglucosamine 2-epimerase (non-hydrolysing)